MREICAQPSRNSFACEVTEGSDTKNDMMSNPAERVPMIGKLNIVHVVNSLDPRSGGPIYALRALIRHQLERGHCVTVIATDMQAGVGGLSRQAFRRQIELDPLWKAVHFHLLRSWGRGRPWNHLGLALNAGSVVADVLDHCSNAATVVHIHGVFSYLSSLASRACYQRKVPYVLEPYGAYDEACFRSNLWPLKLLYHYLFTRWELRHASVVRVASEFEAKPLRRIVGNERGRIVSIPYGVDLPALDNGCGPAARSSDPTVGFLSRLAKKKRPEWVIQACAKLRSEFPNLRVWIAGSDDGHRRKVEKVIHSLGAQKWVKLDGFLHGEAKEAFFQAITVLVLPSKDESLGAVVLEALAHGVPAVVTPGVAAHEYVDSSSCGFTVPDAVEEVAQGIRRILLANKCELGRRGREYVEKNLIWPIINEKVERLYMTLIQVPHGEK